MKEIPIYDISIEDDAEIQGVSQISLVDVPAIGVNFIALKKHFKFQNVFGYETKNFDICPGAQATFKNFEEMTLDEDTLGMIRSAAQTADNIFAIEKAVISAGAATADQLKEVETLVDDFRDIISEVDKITGQTTNVDYMQGHIDKVKSFVKPNVTMARIARKPNVTMARITRKPKAFMKKECLGCPPNGDGTKVNGEPDLRCKGDGAGGTKGAGGKGKASAKPATKGEGKTLPIPTAPDNIKGWVERGAYDDNARSGSVYMPDEMKEYFGNEENRNAILDKQSELNTRLEAFNQKVADYNDKLSEYPIKAGPNGPLYMIPAGPERDALINEQLDMVALKQAIDKEQKELNPMARALKAYDVTMKNAETRTNIANEERTKIASDKKALEKADKAAEKRITNASFENPATSDDYRIPDTIKALNGYEKEINSFEKGWGEIPSWQVRDAKSTYEDSKLPARYGVDKATERANNDYNDIIDREISRLPNPYNAKQSYVNRDNTWDHKNGRPTEPPFKGAKRTLNYERRSAEDVLNGYPQYKIYIDWQ